MVCVGPPFVGRKGVPVGVTSQVCINLRDDKREAGSGRFARETLDVGGDVLFGFEVGRFGVDLAVQVDTSPTIRLQVRRAKAADTRLPRHVAGPAIWRVRTRSRRSRAAGAVEARRRWLNSPSRACARPECTCVNSGTTGETTSQARTTSP